MFNKLFIYMGGGGIRARRLFWEIKNFKISKFEPLRIQGCQLRLSDCDKFETFDWKYDLELVKNMKLHPIFTTTLLEYKWQNRCIILSRPISNKKCSFCSAYHRFLWIKIRNLSVHVQWRCSYIEHMLTAYSRLYWQSSWIYGTIPDIFCM